MTDFNFDDFSPDEEPDFKADLETITADAREAIEIEQTVFELELQVKELNERKRHLLEKRIPYALNELGLSELKLADGSKVTVTECATLS